MNIQNKKPLPSFTGVLSSCMGELDPSLAHAAQGPIGTVVMELQIGHRFRWFPLRD